MLNGRGHAGCAAPRARGSSCWCVRCHLQPPKTAAAGGRSSARQFQQRSAAANCRQSCGPGSDQWGVAAAGSPRAARQSPARSCRWSPGPPQSGSAGRGGTRPQSPSWCRSPSPPCCRGRGAGRRQAAVGAPVPLPWQHMLHAPALVVPWQPRRSASTHSHKQRPAKPAFPPPPPTIYPKHTRAEMHDTNTHPPNPAPPPQPHRRMSMGVPCSADMQVAMGSAV